MSGKVVSLFRHPEFARRAQARAERELAERVVPVVRIDHFRLRCRRCSLEFEGPAYLPGASGRDRLEACPHCEPDGELDVLEGFLDELFGEDRPR
jgi:hypothetical protein